MEQLRYNHNHNDVICVTYSLLTENSKINLMEFMKLHPECRVELVYGVEIWYYKGNFHGYYPGNLIAIKRAGEPTRYYSSAYIDTSLEDCPTPARSIKDFGKPGTGHWCRQDVFLDRKVPKHNDYHAWNNLINEINQILTGVGE